jgi:hypothetical protein
VGFPWVGCGFAVYDCLFQCGKGVRHGQPAVDKLWKNAAQSVEEPG